MELVNCKSKFRIGMEVIDAKVKTEVNYATPFDILKNEGVWTH